MISRIAKIFILALSATSASGGMAATYNIDGARVLAIDGTGSPTSILFTVDKAAGSCASGTGMTFTAPGTTDTQKSASASAVMASLLSAKLTGTTITFGGNDTGCVVSYVQSR